MRFLTLHWWELVAYLFGFSSIIINALWLLTTLKEKPTPSGAPRLTQTLPRSSECIPEVRRRGRVTVWIGIPVLILIAAGVGLAAGYGIRDHQLVVNTFTYEGVTVNSQVNDRKYWVTIPGYTRQRDFEFCHPLKMPAPIVDIKYEQKYGCKQVYGVGFVQPHKEQTDAAIQNGRNSTASAKAAWTGLERRR